MESQPQSLPIPQSPATVHWIRHGEVQLDGPERVYGDMEMPLSERGIAQLEAVAAEISKSDRLTAVYSSNLERAVIGARSILKLQKDSLQKNEPVQEPLFREIFRGEWRGLTWAEVDAQFPGGARRFVTEPLTYRDHRGETLADVERRALAGLARVIRENDGGNIAIVAHSWIVRTVLARVVGLDAAGALNVHADTGSWSTIRGDRAGWRAICINRKITIPRQMRRANDNDVRPTG